MIEKEIQLAEGAQLIVAKAHGDLKLAGWDEARILVRADGSEDELRVQDVDGGVEITIQTNAEVWVPTQLPVTVRQAMGNMRARDLQSELTIGQVHGDLKLSEVGQASVEVVHGNLKAEAMTALQVAGHVHGDAKLADIRRPALQNIGGNLRVSDVDELRAETVGGDLLARDVLGEVRVESTGGQAILRDVGGAVLLENSGGDFIGRDLLGGVAESSVGGNLALAGELGQGTAYRFTVGGDAVLNLDEEASADLKLQAGGRIQCALPLADEQRSRNSLTGRLGDGGIEVSVDAGGNVIVGRGRAGSGAWDERELGGLGSHLGEEISRQVEESLRAIDVDAIGRKANEEVERAMARLRTKLEGVDWDRLGSQAQAAVERSMAQMHREIDRLAERAARQQERAARAAQRQSERHQRRGSRFVDAGVWDSGHPFQGSDRPAERPSFEEERLSILKMLEQGQITLEEAETLLDALK